MPSDGSPGRAGAARFVDRHFGVEPFERIAAASAVGLLKWKGVAMYIGGGAFVLILLVVIIVLLMRR